MNTPNPYYRQQQQAQPAPWFFIWAIRGTIVLAALVLLFAILSWTFLIPLHAQPGPPFVSVPPAVPPSIGAPGISIAPDTTNKVLVVTFSTANSNGTISTLTTISYNPHTLEGQNAGGVLLSFGATAVLLKHNLPTDPLIYQIGVASANGTVSSVVAQCTTVTPVPTGQVACPVLGF